MPKYSSANYHQNNIERLQKVFPKKKSKKRHYGHERYNNLSEDEKQKLVEYRKKYYEMRKKLKKKCFTNKY